MPAGLRDRDYSEHVEVQAGSLSAVAVFIASGATPNTVKTYTFTRANCTASAAGLFSAYTTYPINGTLKAIAVQNNNYATTGSLFLDYSGADIVFNLWNMISGTNTWIVAASGAQMIKAFCRDQNNASLSGTNSIGVWEDMPLYGVFRLVGSGLGNATTCSGVILAYQ